MAIPTTTASAAPFAKLVDLGDSLVGALASNPSESRRQQRNFDTGRPAFKDDGKPALEEILHLVAMPGCTAKLGDNDHGYTVIEPGTHVRFALSGFKWGQAIEARKNLPGTDGGIRPGQEASGDVYEITLVGWSAETKNAEAAKRAGFNVVDGRIILRTQDEKDAYVLAQSRSGGNTNPAKDLTVTVRRPTPADAEWERLADELYLTEPWKSATANVAPAEDDVEGEPAMAGAGYDTEEPF